MAKIRLVYNFSTPQNVIIVWYEFSAPTAEIGRYVLDGTVDHEKVGAYTIDGLDPVMHRVNFYRSSDGVALDTLEVSADIDASLINVPVAEFIEFTVGVSVGAPASGDSQYVNADLDDADITDYTVEQRGFGKLSWGEEIQEIAGGGFEFINGWTFNQEDKYFITVFKLVAQQSTTVTTQNQFADILVLSANDVFDADLYNKLLIANWAGAVGVIDVPSFSFIPNNTVLHLNTHGGAQRNVTLQFPPGETIRFMGSDRTEIHLGKGEEIRIIFKDGSAYVVHYEGDYRHLGERRLGNIAGINEIVLNGSEYPEADYPRLLELVESLPADQVVTYAVWAAAVVVTVAGYDYTTYPNKGLFARSGGNIKVPDDRNKFYRALRYTDGTVDAERQTQATGGHQYQQILAHGHAIKSTSNGPSAGDTGDVMRGSIVGTASTRGSAAEVGDDNHTILLTGGSETRPDNIGLLPLLKI